MDERTPIQDISEEWGVDVYPLLSWFRRDRVQSAEVMVVGCGALGNEVLKNLALFGFEHIIVVDYDRVELSNLTRSILFSHEDAGKLKVEAVARKVRKINPAIHIRMIAGDIAHHVGLGLLRHTDIVISCLDNRLARYYLNRLCMRAGVPWIDGGIDGLEGTARIFAPGQNCYACNLGPEALKELSLKMSCASVIRRNEKAERVATTPIVASIIGAVEVQEALKWLHREELENGVFTSLCGKMFYYEGAHFSSRLVHFRGYDEGCPEHECWEPVIESPLTTANTIEEALETLRRLTKSEQVEIHLCNHCFVDYVVTRTDDRKVKVMRPSYAVADYLECVPTWSGIPTSAFYQHEYTKIGTDFPYPELTLEQIGIPHEDVLYVQTDHGIFYIGMRRDTDNSEKQMENGTGL